MTMGQRIRQAREEAGLSQRELAGEEITRNMLSALEHDGANPSLHTLRYLSKRLGKSVSYFVEEDQGAGQSLRDYGTMPPGDCLEGLKDAQHTPQNDLLRSVCLLDLAEEAVQQGRIPYAKTLLERAQEWMEGYALLKRLLERPLRILLASCAETPEELAALAERIPDADDALLLWARAALAQGNPGKARDYLKAARQSPSAQWHYLMGRTWMAERQYHQAAQEFHLAEEELPQQCRSELEICYRELGDFRRAYYYAVGRPQDVPPET